MDKPCTLKQHLEEGAKLQAQEYGIPLAQARRDQMSHTYETWRDGMDDLAAHGVRFPAQVLSRMLHVHYVALYRWVSPRHPRAFPSGYVHPAIKRKQADGN